MHSLDKKKIVKENSLIQRIYREGKSYADYNLVLYVANSPKKDYKVAFAAGKKLGNAVIRNRVKRIMREAYRLNQGKIKENVCLLLVARQNSIYIKRQDMEKSFLKLVKKAMILKEEVV